MNPAIIPREEVAANLAIPTRVLIRYEALGLVHPVHEGDVEGYAPAEIRRIWTILSFQRDLGINLAGVEVILKLLDRLAEVHHRLDSLAGAFREALEEEPRPDDHA